MLASPQPVVSDPIHESLSRRMAGPQRHRLLHGFPMAPLLEPHPTGRPAVPPGDRPLLVGVLPHPYCNPTVEGCGFCTFPHERYHRTTAQRLAAAVAREIRWRATELAGRPVLGVYFGGGTANLTPPDAFDTIAQALDGSLLVAGAEVTLEGAPAYFGLHDAALLQSCAALRPGHLRISMGVQTFDRGWLGRMGRLGFGAPEHVEAAVDLARRHGATVSCDLLVNLPGQPVEAMRADVRRAAELGFDQVCVYPLVLRDDLPVPFARDPALMRGLPDPQVGWLQWRQVREALLEAGYRPSTITNHERADLPAERRFAYEPASFRPETCDGIGFGPGSLSTFGLGSGRGAVKWMDAGGAGGWLERMSAAPERPVAGFFAYAALEDALAVITRRLSLGRFDPSGSPVVAEAVARLSREIEVLAEAGLLVPDGDELVLTERGVFFADSVAGLLAERLVGQRRLNDAVPHAMG